MLHFIKFDLCVWNFSNTYVKLFAFCFYIEWFVTQKRFESQITLYTIYCFMKSVGFEFIKEFHLIYFYYVWLFVKAIKSISMVFFSSVLSLVLQVTLFDECTIFTLTVRFCDISELFRCQTRVEGIKFFPGHFTLFILLP